MFILWRGYSLIELTAPSGQSYLAASSSQPTIQPVALNRQIKRWCRSRFWPATQQRTAGADSAARGEFLLNSCGLSSRRPSRDTPAPDFPNAAFLRPSQGWKQSQFYPTQLTPKANSRLYRHVLDRLTDYIYTMCWTLMA